MSAAKFIAQPIVSANQHEARRKALRLYRLWYRFIPFISHQHFNHLPVTRKEMYEKLRQEFYKNKDLKDLRVIDMLIHNSRNDLKEVGALYSQQCHIMGLFFKDKDTVKPKPNDFLSKFFSNRE